MGFWCFGIWGFSVSGLVLQIGVVLGLLNLMIHASMIRLDVGFKAVASNFVVYCIGVCLTPSPRIIRFAVNPFKNPACYPMSVERPHRLRSRLVFSRVFHHSIRYMGP